MLDEIETAWLREAPAAINRLVQANSTETFYAASFGLFYCDYTTIGAPALAMNAESAIVTHQTENDAWNTRWVPAEWRWPVRRGNVWVTGVGCEPDAADGASRRR